MSFGGPGRHDSDALLEFGPHAGLLAEGTPVRNDNSEVRSGPDMRSGYSRRSCGRRCQWVTASSNADAPTSAGPCGVTGPGDQRGDRREERGEQDDRHPGRPVGGQTTDDQCKLHIAASALPEQPRDQVGRRRDDAGDDHPADVVPIAATAIRPGHSSALVMRRVRASRTAMAVSHRPTGIEARVTEQSSLPDPPIRGSQSDLWTTDFAVDGVFDTTQVSVIAAAIASRGAGRPVNCSTWL